MNPIDLAMILQAPSATARREHKTDRQKSDPEKKTDADAQKSVCMGFEKGVNLNEKLLQKIHHMNILVNDNIFCQEKSCGIFQLPQLLSCFT